MLVADVSLLRGIVPELLATSALLTLAIASVRMGSRWWLQRVLPIVAVSLLIAIIVNWALDLRSQFDDAIPFEFMIWASMPLIAIGLTVFGWRDHPNWQRAVSIAAIPLTLLYAANLINGFYGYFSTFGALFGTKITHEVGADQLGLNTIGPGIGTQQGRPPTVPGTTHTSSGQTTETTPTTTIAGGDPPTGAPTAPAGGTGGNFHGTISQIDIPGPVSGFKARTAYVWVPPVFFNKPRPKLPVVVMLAGVPGQPDNLIRAASADKAANAYAAAHNGVAPILIFADANGSFTADTECIDSDRGNAETYLSKDLPAFVAQAFGTLTGPSHWGIEGYSEGGTCALMIALAHPDVYGTFVDIAGDQFPNLGTQGDAKAKAIAGLYGGNAALFDAHDPSLLMLKPAAKNVAGWFEVGTKDHKKGDVASTLDAQMRQAGLQSHLTQVPGGHDFLMATRAVADSFAWLCQQVGV